MTTSGLASPPRAGPPPPPPHRAAAPRRPRGARRPAIRYERILGWSLAISVVIHLLLAVLSPLFMRLDVPVGGTDDLRAGPFEPREVQLLNPVVVEGAPELPEPGERDEEPVRPVAARAAAGSDAPAADEDASPGEGAGSARDALRPGYADERLRTAPLEPLPERLTPHEEYMARLSARIQARADSANAAVGAPNTDWTVRDGEGRRWGVSEEGVHLGPLTIPRALIPIPQTGDALGRERAAEKARQDGEIERQERDREIRETQDESIEATRARKDRERDDG